VSTKGERRDLSSAIRRTSAILAEISALGHRVSSLSTSSRETVLRSSIKAGLSGSSVSASNEGRWMLPTPETKATIWMPCAAVRYSSAMAPAATRPAAGQGSERVSYCSPRQTAME